MRGPSACSTAVRRFAGPEAHELALLCRPDAAAPDAASQAEAAYRTLAARLAAEHASLDHLACETLFLRDVRRDLLPILDVRTRVLSEESHGAPIPLPRVIQQAPVAAAAVFELTASAVVPRRRDGWSVRDVRASPACGCQGCARSGARLVTLGERTWMQTTNVYGAGRDAYEQAYGAFGAAERLLQQSGMAFADVVRVWVHLRDIHRDYDALNRARREFFRQRGIERRPASTGVQGVPFPDAHDVSVSVTAVRAPYPLGVAPMTTPSLNEAWSYGADFSRGLTVADANATTLYVSGTASIDEAGRTAHAGDFAAQVERMLHNVATLLARQGASFADVASGVTYLVHAADAPALQSLCRARGFDGFPCALVEAPLCRPELLCETEVVAIVPPAA